MIGNLINKMLQTVWLPLALVHLASVQLWQPEIYQLVISGRTGPGSRNQGNFMRALGL